MRGVSWETARVCERRHDTVKDRRLEGMERVAREIDRELRAAGRPHRAGSVDGHSQSSMQVLGVTVPDLRAIVRKIAKRIRGDDR